MKVAKSSTHTFLSKTRKHLHTVHVENELSAEKDMRTGGLLSPEREKQFGCICKICLHNIHPNSQGHRNLTYTFTFMAFRGRPYSERLTELLTVQKLVDQKNKPYILNSLGVKKSTRLIICTYILMYIDMQAQRIRCWIT